ncbi:hypothetical protein AVEN_216527-1 [Araneus ventricosus]|uniref:Uncharacterized protein n=1 Tax=Araneus ventricosus TaxID=182803 RepID=A0A4Y2EU87_ARAVE|nr:hypothetical protein AVEN_216527-1 [Araneus ventricosus]
MAAHTETPPSNQLLRCVKQLELRMTFRRNSKVRNLGTLLCSLCYHTANGCPHARRSSEFILFTEIIARIQLSSAPKRNLFIIIFFQNLACFFCSKNLVPFFLRQALSLLYQKKMPCQAFPSSLLPEPKVKLFFIGKA